MSKIYLANHISTSSTNANQYGQLTIPDGYKNTTITINWYTQGSNGSSSSGHTVNSFLDLQYKLDNNTENYLNSETRSSSTGNIAANSGTASIVLTNESLLKFRFNYGRTIAGSGTATFSPTFEWTAYVETPFGSINIEDIITAQKLNEVAIANNVSTSVTAGNKIILSAWQTIGTAVGVTLNSTKPLKSDLQAILFKTPGNFEATGTNVHW